MVPELGRGDEQHSWRRLALVFVALAQLMVTVETTIVNIAMPSAKPTSGSPIPTGSG